MQQIIWAGQSGCLLPLLIIFNLFFGRLIFKSNYLWLGVEAALILLFIIKIRNFMRKITREFGQNGRGSASDSQSRRPQGRGRVIDVEGKVVEDKEKLK